MKTKSIVRILIPALICLIFFAFAFSASAETVAKIDLTGVVYPVEGQRADTSKIRVSGEGIAYSSVSWCTSLTGDKDTYALTDQKFVAGNYYALQINLQTMNGYGIPDIQAVTFDGNLIGEVYITQTGGSNSCTVLCVIGQVLKNHLSSVEVSGITAPVAGKAPSSSYTVPSGAHYKVADLSWKVRGEWDWEDFEGSAFEFGKVYAVELEIETLNGYKFPANSYIFGSFTVNGKPAEVYYAIDDGADILLSFGACVPETQVPGETTTAAPVTTATPTTSATPATTATPGTSAAPTTTAAPTTSSAPTTTVAPTAATDTTSAPTTTANPADTTAVKPAETTAVTASDPRVTTAEPDVDVTNPAESETGKAVEKTDDGKEENTGDPQIAETVKKVLLIAGASVLGLIVVLVIVLIAGKDKKKK